MKRFKGKVVLVTGGNRNTGLWIVKKFVDEGARVFMCSCQHMPEDVDC